MILTLPLILAGQYTFEEPVRLEAEGKPIDVASWTNRMLLVRKCLFVIQYH